MREIVKLNDKEFLELKKIIYDESGIHTKKDQRKNLEYKLAALLKNHDLRSFKEFHKLLANDKAMLQNLINTVTTNETYFFRETKHFDFLKDVILPNIEYNTFRCWSAASSNGAEAYSIAMHIQSNISTYKNFEVLASDINDHVLKFAKNGIYSIKFSNRIPKKYLQNYCNKGQNEFEGSFKISDKIQDKVKFRHINLMKPIPTDIESFDLIFLRNMIIYFEDRDKKNIVENVLKKLKPGGYLFMGHSESLERITNQVKQISPSIYQKIDLNKSKHIVKKRWHNKTTQKIIAFGSSMGGLTVIENILPQLKEDCPPILITQHLSRDLLHSIIAKLLKKCVVELKIARDDEQLELGHVYFAPFDKHLKIKKISSGIYKTVLSDEQKIANHKPSIDVLFNSLATDAKMHAIAFILTGMGNDGVKGIENIKKAGGKTYAQDEESCEIFGMAKLAIDRGYIDMVVKPDQIVEKID
ncbi:MAG: CheR family methyltransferase [Campylobacterota bacterium]|nr:CheR family methyltransferase [Campylobacterota bacterium]